MSTYREIRAAREILGLSETATMESIKANYRRLLQKWHPDVSGGDKEEAERMTRRIIAAYKVITDYCRQYRFSFTEETIKAQNSSDDWWFERFGDDPMWGNGMKKK